jgi:hypothetical protein
MRSITRNEGARSLSIRSVCALAHSQAKHGPAKAEVDSGSRKENAIKKRDKASDPNLIGPKTLYCAIS